MLSGAEITASVEHDMILSVTSTATEGTALAQASTPVSVSLASDSCASCCSHAPPDVRDPSRGEGALQSSLPRYQNIRSLLEYRSQYRP